MKETVAGYKTVEREMPYVEIGYIIEGVCQSKGSIESG
jgi:hypothetical protein